MPLQHTLASEKNELLSDGQTQLCFNLAIYLYNAKIQTGSKIRSIDSCISAGQPDIKTLHYFA